MGSDSTSIVLSGLGGYGSFYLSALLDGAPAEPCSLVAGVDPFPQRCQRLDQLRQAGVPVYSSLEEFYATGPAAELAVLAAPIQEHCPQTCLALENGSHVLCEKPLAATVQEADRMTAAQGASGRSVAIGYQWSFAPATHALKADIRRGLYGAPRHFSALCLWPRNEAYYARNNWAGRIRDDRGRWVLDSPVNNAVAHYLHHMLYLLGDSRSTSASPVEVAAELYRANPIENYDTAALRVQTGGGADVHFCATHACIGQPVTEFRLEFEEAQVSLSSQQAGFIARTADGRTKDYGSPEAARREKLWSAIRAVRTGEPTLCGLEAARAHMLCVDGAQDSAGEVVPFPSGQVQAEGEGASRTTYVEGLPQALRACHDRRSLPSELGIDWAQAGQTVSLADYRQFPCG